MTTALEPCRSSVSQLRDIFSHDYLRRLRMIKLLLDKCLPGYGSDEELKTRLEEAAVDDASIDLASVDSLAVSEDMLICKPTKSGERTYTLSKEIMQRRRRQEELDDMAAVLAVPCINEAAARIVEEERSGRCRFSAQDVQEAVERAASWLQPEVVQRLQHNAEVGPKIEAIIEFASIQKQKRWQIASGDRNSFDRLSVLFSDDNSPWERVSRAWRHSCALSAAGDGAQRFLDEHLQSALWAGPGASKYPDAERALFAGFDESNPSRPGGVLYRDINDLLFRCHHAISDCLRFSASENSRPRLHLNLVLSEAEEAMEVMYAFAASDERERQVHDAAELATLRASFRGLADAVLGATHKHYHAAAASASSSHSNPKAPSLMWSPSKGKLVLKDKLTMATELKCGSLANHLEAGWVGALWTAADRHLERPDRKQPRDDVLGCLAAVYACAWLARYLKRTRHHHQ